VAGSSAHDLLDFRLSEVGICVAVSLLPVRVSSQPLHDRHDHFCPLAVGKGLLRQACLCAAAHLLCATAGPERADPWLKRQPDLAWPNHLHADPLVLGTLEVGL